MTADQLDSLRRALRAAPGNALLRAALVRRLIDADQMSEALALVLDLTPEDVSNSADRALIADLLIKGGLADQAASWRAEAAAEDVPDTESDMESDPEPDPEPDPEQPQRGARILRLVGGQDAAEGEVPLPPEPTAPETVTFAEVAGLDQVKKDIHRRIILPFAQPSVITRFRKRAGGGVLLYGPPGCGKTLIARATAGECGAHFLSAALSEVLDPYIGGSEQRLSGLFRTARQSKPTVLFFDEIEALGTKRNAATSSHISQLASHFLSELDGVDARNDGVLVLAATNAPWAMDPAFLRPGRFDRLFFVPPPDRTARRRIIELELDGRLTADGIDPEAIAAATSGRSGADMRQVVETAADAAIDATVEQGVEVPITQRMLMAAVAETRSTVGEWLTTARNYATYSNEGGRYDDILAFLEANRKR